MKFRDCFPFTTQNHLEKSSWSDFQVWKVPHPTQSGSTGEVRGKNPELTLQSILSYKKDLGIVLHFWTLGNLLVYLRFNHYLNVNPEY